MTWIPIASVKGQYIRPLPAAQTLCPSRVILVVAGHVMHGRIFAGSGLPALGTAPVVAIYGETRRCSVCT